MHRKVKLIKGIKKLWELLGLIKVCSLYNLLEEAVKLLLRLHIKDFIFMIIEKMGQMMRRDIVL